MGGGDGLRDLVQRLRRATLSGKVGWVGWAAHGDGRVAVGEMFKVGDRVNVARTSIGKGFQGECGWVGSAREVILGRL